MVQGRQLAAGQILGPYRLVRELGSGGLGVVWLAEAVGAATNQKVAIKFLAVFDDEFAANRFKEEARVLMRLEHPNIPRIYETGLTSDRRLFIVMEYLDGITLRELLRRQGPLPVETALEITKGVSNALSAAHQHYLIHRDLKPANVMLVYEPQVTVKLLDFGVRGTIRRSTNTTQVGEFYGTPQYMAPEQMQALPQSTATDVFGLGAVLFEMLYGKPPFTGNSFFEIATKTMREPVMFPATPVVPTAVRQLIARCLSKDPAQRPKDGGALLDEIRNLQRQAAVSPAPGGQDVFAMGIEELAEAAKTGVYAELAAGKSSTLVMPADAPSAFPLPKISTARQALWFIAACMLLAGMLGLFYWLSLSSQPRTATGWKGVLIGVWLSLGSIALWFGLRKWLSTQKTQIQREADSLLLGTKSRDALTQSLALEINHIVKRVREFDEMLLLHSVALMFKEYEDASDSKDRQNALINAVAFIEKLTTRLSPWYIRHDKLVAFVVTAIGMISGVVTIVQNIVNIYRGK